MERMFKKIFSITALLSVAILQASSSCNECCDVSPCFSPRSQGRDKTRQMVGSVGHTHLYDMESWYGTFSVMFEYTQSFRSRHIAQCLFGCSLFEDCECPGRTIKIQGCKVENREEKALLADYFYLPQDFKSTVSFEPRIRNFLVDLDFYLGMDEWVNGMYFRIYGPITHTRWDLDFCETVEAKGTCSHQEGYFNPTGMDRSKLLTDFSSYVCGAAPASVDGITFQGLKFARMDKCKRTETGFADLRAEWGWNFLQGEDYHLGLNIQFAAPTGGEQDACFLFDALVGNGNHWELGGGLTWHYVFWRSEDEEKHFGFYFDANVTHLFKADTQRSFDICNKPLSRYMLAAKMTKTVTNDLAGDPTSSASDTTTTAATSQFNNEYAPVANISTVDRKISIGAQGDVVAMFNFTARNFSWDIGYNFWGRSCENYDCNDKCDNNCGCPNLCDGTQDNTWVLKGDAHMFGFAAYTGGGVTQDDPIALSASESKAVICKGTNGKDKKKFNTEVDNAKFAVAGTNGASRVTKIVNGGGGFNEESNHIKTSIQPIFLDCCDLDLIETRGISHKVFTHFQYNWFDREGWIPYVGVGGFAEFGKNEDSCKSSCTSGSCTTCCTTACNTSSSSSSCDPCCDKCIDCSLSQWGVWLKGGISFQ